MKTHKLESTLDVSTWTKAYCGFFSIRLDIYWFVLLMELEVMDDLEGQVYLIVQCLSGQHGIGAVNS